MLLGKNLVTGPENCQVEQSPFSQTLLPKGKPYSEQIILLCCMAELKSLFTAPTGEFVKLTP
jgi:hypothetical protein